MNQANVYKVMIGAPSDIKEEITIVEKVLQNWNSVHSEKQKIVLLPLHWSRDSYPSIGSHPQKTINKQVVEKSDLLVCIFGIRLGTPTDSFESGTLEEINEHFNAGKQVMIYFKTSIPNITAIDKAQLSKLDEFKKSIQGKALYKEFSNVVELEMTFSQDLQRHIYDYFISNNQDLGNLPERVPSLENQFSEFDIERLNVWTSTSNPHFFQVHLIGGSSVYGLGAKQYNVESGKERAEWDDFFEKLLKSKFIEIENYDKQGHPYYRLKKAAYNFVEKYSKNQANE